VDNTFDDAAASYNATVQQAIGASGETVLFFAELKVNLMTRVIGERSPGRILDFGCGIGNATRALGRAFPTSYVVGFDISAESLAIAREATADHDGRIEYVSSGTERLPFDDQSIDAAFTSCVFHHIDPAERLHWARELRRVLRRGSPLVLFEHNPNNPLTTRVVRRIPFDADAILLPASETRSLLQRAGFLTSRPWFYFFFPSFLSKLRALEPFLKWLPMGAQYFVVGT
jgi:ubiquinone/menaquinone biosynthesis C-methylase UbiE